MSTVVIPQASPVPLLSEDIVRMIQADFQTNCSAWLSAIYPIAYVGETIVKDRLVAKDKTTSPVFRDRVRKYPRVYLNDGKTDYIDVLPSDKQKGSVFFEVNGTDNISRVDDEIDVTLSMIFWVDMKKVDPSRKYDYRQELIADALKCLDEGSINAYITEINVYENFEEIYTKYDFQGTSNKSRRAETEMQQFMYPYTSFKLEFRLDGYCLDLACLPKFEINC